MKRLIVLLAVAALALAGCSGGSGGTVSTGPLDSGDTGSGALGSNGGPLTTGGLSSGGLSSGGSDTGGTHGDVLSDDGDQMPSTKAAYIDALVDEFDPGASGGSSGDVAAQGRCVATGWVNTIGFDRLQQHGVTPDEFGDESTFAQLGLSHADGVDLVETMESCGYDWYGAIWLQEQHEADLTASQVACLKPKIPRDAVEDLAADDITGRAETRITTRLGKLIEPVGASCGVDLAS